MSRIPKWMLLKEFLTYEDVVKLKLCAPSSIETVLAQDLSEEMKHNFIFKCTFSPNTCIRQFKEYRKEETARKNAREHIKDHINDMNKFSDEERKQFSTRNQLYKDTKSAAQKRKAPVEPVVPNKIRKLRKNLPVASNEAPSSSRETSMGKEKRQKFTKLKKNQPSKLEKVENGCEKDLTSQVNENVETNPIADGDHSESQILIDDTRAESLDADEDKVNSETQTEGAKEEETVLYKIANKMFGVDRSQWTDIEEVIDRVSKLESPSQELCHHEKQLLLAAMEQWMESCSHYDEIVKNHVTRPLTEQEKDFVSRLTTEDFKSLQKKDCEESKAKIKKYVRLLLRDYECCPRKQKPRDCKHCGASYTASTSLFTHLISVAGIRFWVCGKCLTKKKETDATFTRKYSLQYHILKEIGIPRYRCTHSGCAKTHNHTHHQKSHARQHTGEKHYACSVSGCVAKFSNRNTYGRHLLQLHNMILTRTNSLKRIDAAEAEKKVNDARLKARARSKSKREQGAAKQNNSVVTPAEASEDERASPKRTINENILTAANHFYSEVQREEQFAATSTNTEEDIHPSASQLLSGIARDVQKTSSMHDTKQSDNLMGGLNLLATVSADLTTESYTTLLNTQDERTLPDEDDQASGASNKQMLNEALGQFTYNYTTGDKGEELSEVTQNESYTNLTSDRLTQSIRTSKCKIISPSHSKTQRSPVSSGCGSELTGLPCTSFYPENAKDHNVMIFPKTIPSGFIANLNSVHPVPVESAKSLPQPTSLSSMSQNVLHVIPSPIPHVNRTSTSVTVGSNSQKEVFVQAIKVSPQRFPRTASAQHGNALSTNTAAKSSASCASGLTPKTSSQVLTFRGNSVYVTPNTIALGSERGSVNDVKGSVVTVASQTLTNSESSTSERSFHTAHTVKSPLATVTPNVNVNIHNIVPSRIIPDYSDQEHIIDKGNVASNRSIQILRVSDSASSSDTRSVSCLGTKYFIVTPPANQ